MTYWKIIVYEPNQERKYRYEYSLFLGLQNTVLNLLYISQKLALVSVSEFVYEAAELLLHVFYLCVQVWFKWEHHASLWETILK